MIKGTRRSCFHYLICLLLLLAVCGRISAQTFPEPDREQLLNGLKVLFVSRPGDANVFLKLRIKSGAAFDLTGRAGTMALLGDALFPDPATREYVTEQLGGRLEVATTYDAIGVTISGKTGEFERMVELLRGALVSPQLSPENVARLREARLKQLSQRPAANADIADQAIAERLFGNFPYGRTPGGTVESVSKIERADLMLARERFLNADNATLVVIGGIEKLRVLRGLRQLLGSWQKGDRTIPATFRQPEAPDSRVLVVNQSGATTAEVRLALRGLARSDREAAAASLLAQVVRARWQTASPDLSSTFVRHEAHALPGMFVLGASAPTASASKAIAGAQQLLRTLAQTGPTTAELDNARGAILTEMARSASQPESIADVLLDAETFRLGSANDQANSIRSLTVADLQGVAVRLFKEASVATIVVGDFEQLKSTLGGRIQVLTSEAELKKEVHPTVPAKKP